MVCSGGTINQRPDNMNNGFIVTLNDQLIYTYTHMPLPGRLRRYHDEMDKQMDNGIKLGEQWIDQPGALQKQQYVAMTLFNALEQKDTNLVNVVSSFLSGRYQSIKEIRVTEQDDVFNLSIISE